MDPGYDTVDNNVVDDETSPCFEVMRRQIMLKLPEPSSWLTRYSQGLFAACRSCVSVVEKQDMIADRIKRRSDHYKSSGKWMCSSADTLGLKAMDLGLNGSTTVGYGSKMMLLREDWSAALHMATSRSTTCWTKITSMYWSDFCHLRWMTWHLHLVPPVSVKNVCVTNLCTSGNLICGSRHHPQCIKGEHTQLPGANCWLDTHISRIVTICLQLSVSVV